VIDHKTVKAQIWDTVGQERQRANDVLKGKVKDRQHIASVAMIEDPSDTDSGEESIEEKGFYAF
jgi:hypothetical protein